MLLNLLSLLQYLQFGQEQTGASQWLQKLPHIVHFSFAQICCCFINLVKTMPLVHPVNKCFLMQKYLNSWMHILAPWHLHNFVLYSYFIFIISYLYIFPRASCCPLYNDFCRVILLLPAMNKISIWRGCQRSMEGERRRIHVFAIASVPVYYTVCSVCPCVFANTYMCDVCMCFCNPPSSSHGDFGCMCMCLFVHHVCIFVCVFVFVCVCVSLCLVGERLLKEE